MVRLGPRAVASGAILLAALLLRIPADGQGLMNANAAQDLIVVAIDADPTGNTATALGPIDGCVSVASGQSFDVDIVVMDVQNLFGLDTTLTYNGSAVNVLNENAQYFLAANPASRVVDLSETSFPDSDGSYALGIGDLGTGVNSGSGVLARLTLKALAPGSSIISLTNLKVRDANGVYLGDADGDEFFDAPLPEAEIAVDQPCPQGVTRPVAQATPVPAGLTATPAVTFPATVEATASTTGTAQPQPTGSPQPAPAAQSFQTESDDDGFPWALVYGPLAGVAALGLIAAALLRARRRSR